MCIPLHILRLLQRQDARSPARAPYDLSLDEIVRRCREAWQRGATEVCLQGGIHPRYTGETYLAICRAIKAAVPDLHIHAFSPLEVSQGAATLGMSVPEFLGRAESRRACLAARNSRRNPRRRGPRRDLPRQGHHRTMARGDRSRAPARVAHHRDHHVRPCRTPRDTGRATCFTSARCRSAPAASPNSCRCRSCRWRRRC